MTAQTPPVRAPGLRAAPAAGGFALFAVMGALYAMYGPVLPELGDKFSIGAGRTSLVLSAQFAGALTGILAWLVLSPRIGSRACLMAAAILLASGAAGFGLTSAWPAAVTFAGIIGVGFGGLLVGVTTLFASTFDARGAAMLNLLTAVFGLGAILGPVGISFIGADRYSLAFVTGAAFAVVGAWLLFPAPPVAIADVSLGRTLRHLPRVVWGFALLYVLYVGIESGIGGWEATHLLSNGVDEAAAERWAGGFWAAVTVGRFVAVPIALRVPAPRIVTVALVLAAICLLLANFSGIAPVAYVAAGLALAPVFPTGLAWLTSAAPQVASVSTPIVIAAAQLGGVVFPAIIGRLIGETHPSAIPGALVVITAATLTVAILLGRRIVATVAAPA